MYATLSYDVSIGPVTIEEVRTSIVDLFKDRATCDLLADTFICDIENTADYLAVVKDLQRLGSDLDGQFQYVFTLHPGGAKLRSNAPFSKAKAKDIIGEEP